MLWMRCFDAPWLLFWPPLWTTTHIREGVCWDACHGGIKVFGVFPCHEFKYTIQAKNVRQQPRTENEKQQWGTSQVSIKSKGTGEIAAAERGHQGSLGSGALGAAIPEPDNWQQSPGRASEISAGDYGDGNSSRPGIWERTCSFRDPERR